MLLTIEKLRNKKMEKDFFGFEKAIEIDHLTNEEVDEIFNMFGDK